MHYICMSLLKILCRYTVVNEIEPHSIAQNPKPPNFIPLNSFFFFKIYFILAVLDIHCWTWTFSICSVWVSHCGGFSCGDSRHMGFSS